MPSDPAATVGSDPASAGEGASGAPKEMVETDAPADPRLAGSLVVALRRVPNGLDPLGDLEPWAQRVADDLVFEGLLRRAGDHAPFVQPALADRCIGEPESAPHTVYCQLRSDARFHDGDPVTPADVVYSLSWWLDPRRERLRQRHGLGGLRRVELVDAPTAGPDADVVGSDPAGGAGRWIAIGFAGKEPLAFELVAQMKVVPEDRHRGHASSFAHEPVGTGPMRAVVLEEDRWVLERTGEGARRPSAELERIVLRSVPDGAEALTLLRRGEVHVLAEVSPVHLPGELTKPGMGARFRAWLLTPARYDVLLYNLRRGVQAGPRLRRALDVAAPRTEVARLHFMPPQRDPGGAPLGGPVDLHDPTPIDLAVLRRAGVSATWGMAGLPDPLDASREEQGRAEAERIFDELGWSVERGLRRRGGNALRLVVMWNGERGQGRKVAAAVRDAWRAIGVQVPYATASWSYVHGLIRKGEFDIGMARMVARTDEDLYRYFHTRGAINSTGVSDPELDAALEDFRRADDRAGRLQAKMRIAARLAALHPMTVLYAPTQVMLVSRRIAELRFVDDLPVLDRIELGPEAQWLGDP